jgi:hypothetical protein
MLNMLIIPFYHFLILFMSFPFIYLSSDYFRAPTLPRGYLPICPDRLWDNPYAPYPSPQYSADDFTTKPYIPLASLNTSKS